MSPFITVAGIGILAPHRILHVGEINPAPTLVRSEAQYFFGIVLSDGNPIMVSRAKLEELQDVRARLAAALHEEVLKDEQRYRRLHMTPLER